MESQYLVAGGAGQQRRGSLPPDSLGGQQQVPSQAAGLLDTGGNVPLEGEALELFLVNDADLQALIEVENLVDDLRGIVEDLQAQASKDANSCVTNADAQRLHLCTSHGNNDDDSNNDNNDNNIVPTTTTTTLKRQQQ